MAKKKSKIISNRGFATTSAPSKKVELPVVPTVAEKAPKPASPPPQQQEKQPFEDVLVTGNVNTVIEDEISTLVTKYASLHEHKAQATFDRLSKDDSQWQQLSEEKIKKFRLSADLEKNLLQVIKNRQGDMFGKNDCGETHL
jgi:hypothetical protein